MKLVLILLLFSLGVLANEIPPAGVTPDLLISTVKEMNIEQTMLNSSEVRKCLQDNKYVEGATDGKIEAAQNCFKTALAGKSKEQIQELSDKLGLQDYNLVQGRTTKEITQYLSDRLYKAMKGVDRDEEKFLNFKKMKMTDQRDFYDLYKTQLTKTSLFEINRFCFQDLRLRDPPEGAGNNFSSHWASFFAGPDGNWERDKFTDTGSPAFGSPSNSQEKSEIYRSLSQSLGTNTAIFQAAEGQKAPLGKFFEKCLSMIKPLCDLYEANPVTGTPGKKACLTKDRIRHLEKAIVGARQLGETWDGLSQQKGFQIADLNFYDRGRTDSSNSIDNLTNFSSAEFLNTQNQGSDNDRLMERCSESAELAECEQFFLEGNFDETKHNIELKATLRKELDLAQIEKIKANRQTLEKYLQDQGYYEMLTKLKANDLTVEQIPGELEKIYDARKQAMISEIDGKLKSRQLRNDSPEPAAGAANPSADSLRENVDAAKSERERLAQVILFNNIISSHISLSKQDGDTTTEIGRNLNILKSEVQGQEQANIEVEGSLFENLRAQASEGTGGSTENFDSIDVGSLFSKIIGERPED